MTNFVLKFLKVLKKSITRLIANPSYANQLRIRFFTKIKTKVGESFIIPSDGIKTSNSERNTSNKTIVSDNDQYHLLCNTIKFYDIIYKYQDKPSTNLFYNKLFLNLVYLLLTMLPVSCINFCSPNFLNNPYIREKVLIIMLKYYNITEDTFNNEIGKWECLSKNKGNIFFELIKLSQQSCFFIKSFDKVKDTMNINCWLSLCQKGTILTANEDRLSITKNKIPWKGGESFQIKKEAECKLLWIGKVNKYHDFINRCSKSFTFNGTGDNCLFIKKYDTFFTQTCRQYPIASSFSNKKLLKVEKENLEIRLIKKLDELKEICIEEGELTGELPKEIYKTLMPGEPEPKINRRVGATFKISNDILKNLTNEGRNEVDRIVQMEVDINVQRAIVSAERYLSCDKSTHKSIRKRRRKDFIAANKKLKHLEKCLTQERSVVFRNYNLESSR
uniref:Cytohesin Ubiquitin Protein Inducing domain-containing protein n=1 Tax=Strongyloides stercoralis TaxID=6248 RepID=A0AAF5CY54_STRER